MLSLLKWLLILIIVCFGILMILFQILTTDWQSKPTSDPTAAPAKQSALPYQRELNSRRQLLQRSDIEELQGQSVAIDSTALPKYDDRHATGAVGVQLW